MTTINLVGREADLKTLHLINHVGEVTDKDWTTHPVRVLAQMDRDVEGDKLDVLYEWLDDSHNYYDKGKQSVMAIEDFVKYAEFTLVIDNPPVDYWLTRH